MLQVEFDPDQISYSDLLQLFWDSHNPASKPWSRQYMSIIFFHNEEQEIEARGSKAALEQKLGAAFYTEIVPYTVFYLAEDYHQKYYLQGEPELSIELRACYPDYKAFTDSTVAARLNAFIGGFGATEQLEEELEQYGLSPRGEELIRELVR